MIRIAAGTRRAVDFVLSSASFLVHRLFLLWEGTTDVGKWSANGRRSSLGSASRGCLARVRCALRGTGAIAAKQARPPAPAYRARSWCIMGVYRPLPQGHQ